MITSKSVLTIAVAALLSAGALTAGGASSADGTTTSTSVMHVEYLSRVLGANPSRAGQTRVLVSNGSTISIPTDQLTKAESFAGQVRADTLAPNDTVPGNCGSSYITMDYNSDHKPVHMDTGFTVDHEAVSYAWQADEAGSSGTGYNYKYNASGGLALRSSWHGQHASHKPYPTGTYAGSVDAPASYAELDNGSFCFSGGPYDSAHLYN